MADRPTITTLAAGGVYSTETLNTNFQALRDAFDALLGVNGTSGSNNTMTGDLDLNSNNIRNATLVSTNYKTILNGSGAPASGTGNNGDFYIDTNATAIYGPKASGAWPSAVSLVGPTGAAGAAGAAGADGVFSAIASQAEAEAGTENTKGMTALRTAQAIAALETGEANADLASQAEAEAGTENTKTMTALRTSQAITALGSSGGATTLINTYTPSGVTAQDIEDTTAFDGTYDIVEFHILNVQVATDGTDFRLQVAKGATPTYQTGASDYAVSMKGAATTGDLGAHFDAAGDFIDLSFNESNALDGMSNVSGETLDAIVRMYRPNDTAGVKKLQINSSYESERNSLINLYGTGWYVGTNEAITGIRFGTGSGNFSATIRVYGYNKT